MPTPDSRRRLSRRTRDAQDPDDEESAAPPRRGRRSRAAPRSPLVPILVVGGAVLLGVGLFLATRDGREPGAESKPSATPATTVASAPPTEPAPVAPIAAPVPPTTATPKPVAPPSPQALLRKLADATSAAAAAELAREAEKLGGAELIERGWTRVYELDPDDATAREKLDVRALLLADDLPGYAAIKRAPQRVHLRPFEEAARGEKTRAERAELLARWEPVRAAIEERIAKSRTLPYYREVDELRIALQQDEFFSTLDYEMVESRPPYALFVEVEGTPEQRSKRRDDAEKSYTPFLDAYDRKIRSYLVPLAPKPPEQEPLFPVFVFLSFERYGAYCASNRGSPPPAGQRAHYEPWKKQSFTYSPVLKIGLGAFQEGTQTLLHELTHAWVDQLASSDGGESRAIATLASHWFSEGIAEYMSCQFMHQDEVRFQPWRSNRVSGTYRPPGWRIPLRTALTIPLHGLDGMAADRVRELPTERRAAAIGTISSGFYADMSNFILWLNLRSGADRPAQFEAYAREELAGRGGFEAFQRCVPKLLDEVADLDATIDDFVKRIANGKINPYKEFEEARTSTPAKPGQ